MEMINVVIVVQSESFGEMLSKALSDFGRHVDQVFYSGEEALAQINIENPSVIFMEINSGTAERDMSNAVKLFRQTNAQFIFITNSKDKLIRKVGVFDANAIYFLKKPLNHVDMVTAVDLAERNYRESEGISKSPDSQSPDQVFIRDGNIFKRFSVRDIIYIRAEGSYSKLVTANHHTYLFSENLSFLEEKLSFFKDIVRIHRTYLINLNYIDKIQENRLWIDDEEIPVGKTYRQILRDKVRFL